jgi:hypothetical protein
MGDNKYDQSGYEIRDYSQLKSIAKLDYFRKKNLKIKKIVCGGGFNTFLTG